MNSEAPVDVCGARRLVECAADSANILNCLVVWNMVYFPSWDDDPI